MQSQSGVASSGNGASTPHDLFALTDEQILEIEPEAQDATVSRGPWPVPLEEKPGGQGQAGAEPAPNGPGNRAAAEKPKPESQVTTNSSSTEHARVLDDFDRAYFGTAGKSAQEVSASRAQLAQTMLREDPAAFREMVFAGLRALEDLGKRSGETTVARALRPESVSSSVSAAPTDRKSLTPEGV